MAEEKIERTRMEDLYNRAKDAVFADNLATQKNFYEEQLVMFSMFYFHELSNYIKIVLYFFTCICFSLHLRIEVRIEFFGFLNIFFCFSITFHRSLAPCYILHFTR